MCSVSFSLSSSIASRASCSSEPLIYQTKNFPQCTNATSSFVIPNTALCYGNHIAASKTGFRSFCAVVKKKFPKSIPPFLTPEESSRRLYIGRFPRRTSKDELAQMFGEHGDVENVEIQYNRRSRRSRRFGFVTMKTIEDANAAAEKLNGTDMGGYIINVNIVEKPVTPRMDPSVFAQEEAQWVDSPYKLNVSNLSRTVTGESLRKHISRWTNVLSARVERHPGVLLSKRYGFVTFSSEKDMLGALECNYSYLEGKCFILSKVVEPEEFI